MSTEIGSLASISTRKRATLALAVAAWIAACSAAWRGGASSGGELADIAAAVGTSVAAAASLSEPCRELATRIVDAGMRVRIAAGRPTVPLLREMENELLSDWESTRCPDRALPLIAYGVVDGVKSMDRMRHPARGR